MTSGLTQRAEHVTTEARRQSNPRGKQQTKFSRCWENKPSGESKEVWELGLLKLPEVLWLVL